MGNLREQGNLMNCLCKFQINIKQITQVNAKYPCSIFIQCLDHQKKKVIHETKSNIWEQSSNKILFNQSFQYETIMEQNIDLEKFGKKQIIFHNNLIVKNRPYAPKPFGILIIDLADILNKQKYLKVKSQKLLHCSNESSISFSIKLLFIQQIQSKVQNSYRVMDWIYKLRSKVPNIRQSYEKTIQKVKQTNGKQNIEKDETKSRIQIIYEQINQYNLKQLNLNIQQNDTQQMKRYKKVILQMKKCNQQQEAYIQYIDLEISQKQQTIYSFENQCKNTRNLLRDYQQISQDNKQIKQQLSQIKDKNIVQQQTLQQKLMQIQQLNNAISTIKQQLNKQKQKNSKKQKQINQQNNAMSKMQLQLKRYQKMSLVIQQQLNTIKKLQYRIYQLNELNQTSSREKIQRNAYIEQLICKIQALEQQLEERTQDGSNQNNQLIQLLKKLDENNIIFNKQLNRLIQQNNQLKQIQAQNQSIIQEYQQIIDHKQSEQHYSKLYQNEQNNIIDQLQSENKNLRIQFSRIQGQCKILQIQKNMINDQLIIDENKIAELQQTIQVLNCNLKQHMTLNSQRGLNELKLSLQNFIKENQLIKKQIQNYKKHEQNNYTSK